MDQAHDVAHASFTGTRKNRIQAGARFSLVVIGDAPHLFGMILKIGSGNQVVWEAGNMTPLRAHYERRLVLRLLNRALR